MKSTAVVIFLLLAACATTSPTPLVQPAVGMNDDSNAAPGSHAVSGNTGIPVGPDADAANYDPVQPFTARGPAQDSRKAFFDAANLVGDAALILTKLF